MRNRVTYEWAVEKTADDSGDIDDVRFWPSYAEAVADAATPVEAGTTNHIALVRSVGIEADGMVDRSYAYLKEDRLPDFFENDHRVPQRFHREFRS